MSRRKIWSRALFVVWLALAGAASVYFAIPIMTRNEARFLVGTRDLAVIMLSCALGVATLLLPLLLAAAILDRRGNRSRGDEEREGGRRGGSGRTPD
jgi:NhaP-type Na+/H+ or K+/H+ antiporter